MINIIKETFFKIKSIKIANQLMEKDSCLKKSLNYDFTQHLPKNHKFFENFSKLSTLSLNYMAHLVNPDLIDKEEKSLLHCYAKADIDIKTFEKVLIHSHNPYNINRLALTILETFFEKSHNAITPKYENQKEKFLMTMNHPDLNFDIIFHGWKGSYNLFDELIIYCFNYSTLSTHEQLFVDLTHTRLSEVINLDSLTNSYERWVELFNNGHKTQASESLYKKLLPIIEKDRLEQIISKDIKSSKKMKI